MAEYECDICNEKAVEEFDDGYSIRAVCQSCGYVHEGASDPWDLYKNDEIEKLYKKGD